MLIFEIGPWEEVEEIGQTKRQTKKQNYVDFSIDDSRSHHETVK